MKKTINISVRNLVSFFLRSGDFGPGQLSSPLALDAIRAHQKIQNSRGEDYQKEVSLRHTIENENYIIEVRGRLDGVFHHSDRAVIEEIKTTNRDLKEITATPNSLHWGQAKCYGFMYAYDNQLSQVAVQLVYYRLTTGEISEVREDFSREALTAFFDDLVSRYIEWMNQIYEWRKGRDKSLQKVCFPFETYRAGQREMAVNVYQNIRDKEMLMIQAPTGIGKTMSALFPALKALGEGLTSGIFYLTARTTGRYVAEDSLDILRNNGLRLKSLTLTAREKTCLNPGKSCSPGECTFAEGYFDRLHAGLSEFFARDNFNLEGLEDVARKHSLCPHAFSMELVPWCDCVICDYNYLFDPQVQLHDFFDSEKAVDWSVLIDEAHNLVDRAREMYSADLNKQALWDLKKSLGKEFPALTKNLLKINRWMAAGKKEAAQVTAKAVIEPMPEDLSFLLTEFVEIVQPWLAQNIDTEWQQQLLEVFFKVTAFIKIARDYDENYTTIEQIVGRDFVVKLFCVNPARHIQKVLTHFETTVLFSATLLPIMYFKEIFGFEKNTPAIYLPSPFPEENLCLTIANQVSTRYVHRDQTSNTVVSFLQAMTKIPKGRILFYFPSYEYMNKIHDIFIEKYSDGRVLLQTRGMSEEERNNFLAPFNEEGDGLVIGFAVMGGIFGEGIDLIGSRLTGAVIVGLGLPGISLERDLIMDHFNGQGQKGFEFAYLFPGLNRVFQAIGRVIRSETDRGAVLLIDDRLSGARNRSFFPSHWKPTMVGDETQLSKIIKDFFC